MKLQHNDNEHFLQRIYICNLEIFHIDWKNQLWALFHLG